MNSTGGIKCVQLSNPKGKEEVSQQPPAAACPWQDDGAIINLLPGGD